MIKAGLIGFGYWGPNLARNLYASKEFKLECICDEKKDNLLKARKLYPNIKLTEKPEDVLNNPLIEAVIIASSVNTHYDFARQALLNGKDVLIEKPMTDSFKKAAEIYELSLKLNRKVMIDHTFLYNGAVRKIKEIIDKKSLGNIQYIDSTRINLGKFQNDVNVLWDLASHDISIINFLMAEKPQYVQAIGKIYYSEVKENIAFLILHYSSGLIAHMNCSWLSPVKIRKMLIGGSKKMIVYDDIEPSDKIKIYDSSVNVLKVKDKGKILVDYRVGDITIPKFSIEEPLSLLIKDFALAIKQGKKPVSDILTGLETVKILELAQESIVNNGKLLNYKL
ncbi:MAG: Gfo/Idh/MocA family oxidoreductase [Bacteroidales bacterium]|nr:Gfo/Idh/MocA family oxidoreductase [Bacteroidales bacterium]